MKPVFQTIFDADAGNCLTAAIASILELPIEAVPNFAKEHGDDAEEASRAWFAERGMRSLTIGFANYETFRSTFFDNHGDYCILTGPSNYPNRAHAVVGRVTAAGSIKVVHDPIPNGKELPQGYRWVRFIIGVEK